MHFVSPVNCICPVKYQDFFTAVLRAAKLCRYFLAGRTSDSLSAKTLRVRMNILPRDAMHSAVFAAVRCSFVCHVGIVCRAKLNSKPFHCRLVILVFSKETRVTRL